MEGDIFKKISNIIYEQTFLEKDDIENTSHIYDDLGLDSLDCLEIICDIEEEFNIQISDEEFNVIKTIDEIISLVYSKIKN
jgi:acyl carrier protein